MNRAKEILMKQLEKMGEMDDYGAEEQNAHAMCEIARTLIEIERAEIALGKREFGSGIKKGK